MKVHKLKVRAEPKYSLHAIKRIFNKVDKLRMTASAMQGQYDLLFSDQNVVDAIQALVANDFYKSMPPQHEQFTEWHDVYKSTFNGVKLYIKFQIDKRGEMIISFKAR